MDQLFHLEFQYESIFNLEFQPKFGIQLGFPIPMGINLGECRVHKAAKQIHCFFTSYQAKLAEFTWFVR